MRPPLERQRKLAAPKKEVVESRDTRLPQESCKGCEKNGTERGLRTFPATIQHMASREWDQSIFRFLSVGSVSMRDALNLEFPLRVEFHSSRLPPLARLPPPTTAACSCRNATLKITCAPAHKARKPHLLRASPWRGASARVSQSSALSLCRLAAPALRRAPSGRYLPLVPCRPSSFPLIAACGTCRTA